jgi:kinesin family protein 3/17
MSFKDKDIAETVKVFLRQRPRLPTDYNNTSQEAEANFSGIQTIGSKNKSCTYYSAVSRTKQQFLADHFFDGDAIQDELFEEVAKPIVETSLHGYAGLILAYGPTSSGKTFTMRGGTAERRGIMPRCIEYLLNHKGSQNVEIWASYLQIYCETVTDLLNSNNTQISSVGTATATAGDASYIPPMENDRSASVGLAIREKTDGEGVYVEGLSKYRITSLEDLNELLMRGDENRSTAATNYNETSSRSHAALMLSIIIPDDVSDGSNETATKTYKEGQLVLVDLAGSERAKASEGRGYQRAEEAKAINLSLSSLGNCMSALAEGRSHIPYRDSKLTRLLQNCLGGTARTAVIVTVLPGNDSTGETLNALRFASRASKVKVLAKVSQYKNYEALYKDTISKLKSLEHLQLQQQQNGRHNDYVSIEEVKKRDDIIDKQKLEMDNMKQQVLALQRENELLKSSVSSSISRSASNKTLPTTSMNQDSLPNDNGEWKDKLDKLTKEHLQVIDSMNRIFQSRLNECKLNIKSLSQDVINAQVDLKQERERHLKTVQDLRAMQERKMKDELELRSRIDELLSESGNKQNLVDDAKALMENMMSSKSQLEMELMAAKERLGQMVTIEKVKEMEGLFMDTITRLSERVQNLEKSKNGGTSSSSGGGSRPLDQQSKSYQFWNPHQNAKSYDNDGDSSVKTSSSDRVVRLEPGGRIRSTAIPPITAEPMNRAWSGDLDSKPVAPAIKRR